MIKLLERDGIDLIFDLSGHTAGNRLDVISQTIIPKIQFLGYPNLAGNYYQIVDNYTNTSDSPFYLKMPKCFLSYTPILQMEPTRRKFDDKIYFGCLARISKINKETVSAWMKILNSLPNSVLILKSRVFEKKETKREWLAKFEDILEDRIIFLNKTNSHKEHLELFNKIDLHLDTNPYSGTTITCESLYMNTPVLTLVGKNHVSRVSASILNTCGLEDCVAQNWEEYIFKAKKLTMKPKMDIRERFIKNMMNHTEYIQDFENLLLNIK